jgi:hypothetical protein
MHSSAPPAVSVLICARNEARYLDATLRSLADQRTTTPFEVVVVDNGSTDTTRDIALKYTTQVLGCDIRGKVPALMHGAPACRADIVAMADADTVYPPAWIRTIDESFRSRPECHLVFGSTNLAFSRDAPLPAASHICSMAFRLSTHLGVVPSLGFNMALRKPALIAALDAIGPVALSAGASALPSSGAEHEAWWSGRRRRTGDVRAAGSWGTGKGADDLAMVTRLRGQAFPPVHRLKQAAESLGPRVLVGQVRSAADLVSEQVARPRDRMVLLTLLAVFGLLLTLVGIFSMTAYAVARRTREIGVRVAFGALPADVVGVIVRTPCARGLGARRGTGRLVLRDATDQRVPVRDTATRCGYPSHCRHASRHRRFLRRVVAGSPCRPRRSSDSVTSRIGHVSIRDGISKIHDGAFRAALSTPSRTRQALPGSQWTLMIGY